MIRKASAYQISAAFDDPWLSYYKNLIKRWDSERELFYDDIQHVLQSTIDLRQNYGTNIGHIVY